MRWIKRLCLRDKDEQECREKKKSTVGKRGKRWGRRIGTGGGGTKEGKGIRKDGYEQREYLDTERREEVCLHP